MRRRETSHGMQAYKRYTKRKVLFILFCLIGVAVLFGLSLTVGARDISFAETYRIVYRHIVGTTYVPGSPEWFDDYAIFKIRLPETVFAIVAGASLAVAGVAMQSVMNNPLADAYTTGISSGACLGVAVASVLGFSVIKGFGAQVGLIANAFIFSLIPMAMIVAVSRKMNTSPASLILAGVAISYFLNAFTMLLMLMADNQTLSSVYKWQIGTIEGMNWDDIPIMFCVSVVGAISIYFLSDKLNILSMGDKGAKALGLDIERLRVLCLLIMSFMVASIISFAGIIGFVGLVCPHIVRMVIDADNRYVIPASAAVGAFMLLGAKIISGYISPPSLTVPVGVILSFVGAPIFLALILRRKSNVW